MKNDNLLKYIYYTQKTPLEQSDFTEKEKNDLVYTKIVPAPFDEQIVKEEQNELRLFFAEGSTENRKVLEIMLAFQIITHASLWPIHVNNEMRIRTYEIMKEIVNTFEDKKIQGIGTIKFNERFVYRHISERHGAYELLADITTFG